jgi:perosamine synthetase
MNLSEIKKYLILRDATIGDAMKTIDQSGISVAFVVNEDKKLCGVISDGDIRRALLSGSHVGSRLSNVMNKKFVFAKEGEDYPRMVHKIHGHIKIVPIIDKNGCVTDFIGFDKQARIPVASPSLLGNEFSYLTDAFLSTWISSTGQYITRFENEFAKFCGCKYGVAVSNGTVALHLSLVALGVGRGDEVIVPDLTFAASANAVLHAGAKPVLVDVDKNYWTIDPKEIEKAITPRTKAIMPVHIYGQPCDMDKISKIAKKHKLLVVEDCAEAHGAKFGNRRVGSLGAVGCFSFYANKVITTGEGGMCVTNSLELYEKMKSLRDHGMSKEKKYWHDEVGFNYRMTNIQAAIGCAQLERIENNLKMRKILENRYRKILAEFNFIKFPKDAPKRSRIVWLACALITNGKRDKLLSEFSRRNIDARPFFYSLGDMPLYKKFVFSNANSKNISALGMNLPTQNNLNDRELDRVRDAVRNI